MADTFRSPEAARRLANAVLIGTVAEVDLAAARVIVEIEDGWSTAPLPWIEVAAGRLRTWSPPAEGEQVTVLSPSGEPGAGVVLRGLPSDAFPPPANSADLTRLQWDDGGRDDYDAAAHARTITIPEGGAFRVILAGALIEAEGGRVSITVGGAGLEITDGAVRLTGDAVTLDADEVNLGGEGGDAVARVDDPVASGKITAGSSKVKAV